jgi:hypothetical protein
VEEYLAVVSPQQPHSLRQPLLNSIKRHRICALLVLTNDSNYLKFGDGS